MATNKREYIVPVAIHPGVMLSEWLEEREMTGREFALRSGKPEKTISKILNGKSRITDDTAESFSIVTGIPSNYLLRFQAEYDVAIARQSNVNPMENLWDTFGCLFPYSEMCKAGWIDKKETKVEKMYCLLSFFGLTTHEAFEMTYSHRMFGVSFRQVGRSKRTEFGVAAWVRQGQIIADMMSPEREFSVAKAMGEIDSFKSALMAHDLPLLISLCSNVGIKLVFVENITKASTSGAAYWQGRTPIIQLSGKGRSLDKLAFNFFHELGHIIYKHAKKGFLLDDMEEDSIEKHEMEANEFASNHLYKGLKEFSTKPTLQEIKEEGRRLGLSPCVVLGHLTHSGLITYPEANTRYKSLQCPLEIDFKKLLPKNPYL